MGTEFCHSGAASELARGLTNVPPISFDCSDPSLEVTAQEKTLEYTQYTIQQDRAVVQLRVYKDMVGLTDWQKWLSYVQLVGVADGDPVSERRYVAEIQKECDRHKGGGLHRGESGIALSTRAWYATYKDRVLNRIQRVIRKRRDVFGTKHIRYERGQATQQSLKDQDADTVQVAMDVLDVVFAKLPEPMRQACCYWYRACIHSANPEARDMAMKKAKDQIFLRFLNGLLTDIWKELMFQVIGRDGLLERRDINFGPQNDANRKIFEDPEHQTLITKYLMLHKATRLLQCVSNGTKPKECDKAKDSGFGYKGTEFHPDAFDEGANLPSYALYRQLQEKMEQNVLKIIGTPGPCSGLFGRCGTAAGISLLAAVVMFALWYRRAADWV